MSKVNLSESGNYEFTVYISRPFKSQTLVLISEQKKEDQNLQSDLDGIDYQLHCFTIWLEMKLSSGNYETSMFHTAAWSLDKFFSKRIKV